MNGRFNKLRQVITGLERKKTALLRCNSRNIEFTLLNGTVQCFLVILQSYTAITAVFSEHFHHLRMNPSTISVLFLFSALPSSWQPLIYLLFFFFFFDLLTFYGSVSSGHFI